MKDFFKYTLATMTGIIVTCIILFFITSAVVVSLVSFADKQEVDVKPGSVLQMNLNYPIKDRTPQNTTPMIFGEMVAPLGLNEILENLDKAEKDSRIEGIFLNISNVAAGSATITEIRDALEDFKKTGKFIYAYSEMYTQKAYYLATVADKVFLNPIGAIDFKGLNAQVMFYKNLLETVDVEVQILRPDGNKYKSAVEPYFLEKMSEANKEQTGKYVNAIWDTYLDKISESRNITKEQLNIYADELTGLDSERALEANLVDQLAYLDEVYDFIDEAVGKDKDGKITAVTLSKYRNAEVDDDEPKGREKIAVIYASGNIVDGKGDESKVGSIDFAKAIRKARLDDKIKAVVLRVNSPGGSVMASDVILREMRLLKEEKPVIASYGDVAASGGYYISCFADRIVAMPNTITGSIGVFGMFPNFEGLLKEKIGITTDNVSTNKNAGFPDVFRPLNDYEFAELKRNVTDTYFNFTSLVGEGRGMEREAVDAIGQGRVWAGTDAIEIGLIDEFGGLERAIEIAAEEAGLESYRLRQLPDIKDPIEQLMEMIGNQASTNVLENAMGPYYQYVKTLKNIEEMQGLQARLPYDIYIN